MKQRGRKSGLSIVEKSAVSALERPDAPEFLTSDEANEWCRVVNSLPAEWFADYSTASLVQYCKHVVNAGRVASLIEDVCSSEAETLDIREYDKLLAMQERESRILLSLMTKMRMTQQSTYSDKKSPDTNVKRGRPWDK